jgi:hypothetical protein
MRKPRYLGGFDNGKPVGGHKRLSEAARATADWPTFLSLSLSHMKQETKVTTNSSMEARPEPIQLAAQDAGDGRVRVVRVDEIIVAETNSADFVKDAIKELKLRGHDHETHVVIHGVSHNSAWNGAIKQHHA